jgi:hypothetical protein
VPGQYKGKTISGALILSTPWPDTVPIRDEHDGREIGRALLRLSNSSLTFIYDLDEDIENAGWSAAMDVRLDQKTGEVVEITKLDHIALTRSPTVAAAKMRLSEEESKMTQDNGEDLKGLVEALRLELSEIKKTLEEKKTPEEPQRPLHERLDLSLGETPTIEEIVRAGLDVGVF